MRIRVVLVEPRYEGNVGAVARLIRNFGAEELVLVRPCRLGAEARKRAMHAADILDAAETTEDLGAAVRDADFVVGTSAINTASEKRFARISVTPRDLARRLATMDGLVALVFGREDYGLYDSELAVCDLLVTIPASSVYPILNVSHAATIVLYELFAAKAPKRRPRPASGLEKEKLHNALTDLLRATDYPAHKDARTRIMFRRLMGRAVPSKWEFHALMGVFQRATKRIKRLEEKD